MTNHIDLGAVLRQTMSAELYSNLVTRPTGAAVRTQIERVLESDRTASRALAIIDFSRVSMIDLSCADEIIAKLLLRYMGEAGGEATDREAYFVFRGMTDDHWDSIETVLERHGLAIVAERSGSIELMGVLSDGERRAFEAVKRRGRAASSELAVDLHQPEGDVRVALDRMWRRRLIMRYDDAYMPVGELA
jgi:hypothetical protein